MEKSILYRLSILPSILHALLFYHPLPLLASALIPSAIVHLLHFPAPGSLISGPRQFIFQPCLLLPFPPALMYPPAPSSSLLLIYFPLYSPSRDLTFSPLLLFPISPPPSHLLAFKSGDIRGSLLSLGTNKSQEKSSFDPDIKFQQNSIKYM